jgi:hypothetical protein
LRTISDLRDEILVAAVKTSLSFEVCLRSRRAVFELHESSFLVEKEALPAEELSRKRSFIEMDIGKKESEVAQLRVVSLEDPLPADESSREVVIYGIRDISRNMQ